MDDSNFKELKIKAAKELKFIDDIERQRNMFEKWYKSIYGFGSLERVTNNRYAYQVPQTAWESWQACCNVNKIIKE